MSSLLLRIDYDRRKPETYRGVLLEHEQGVDVFGTGDPVQDWQAAHERALEYARRNPVQSVLLTSSCGHFVADSHGSYCWASRELLFSTQLLLRRSSDAVT